MIGENGAQELVPQPETDPQASWKKSAMARRALQERISTRTVLREADFRNQAFLNRQAFFAYAHDNAAQDCPSSKTCACSKKKLPLILTCKGLQHNNYRRQHGLKCAIFLVRRYITELGKLPPKRRTLLPQKTHRHLCRQIKVCLQNDITLAGAPLAILVFQMSLCLHPRSADQHLWSEHSEG